MAEPVANENVVVEAVIRVRSFGRVELIQPRVEETLRRLLDQAFGPDRFDIEFPPNPLPANGRSPNAKRRQ